MPEIFEKLQNLSDSEIYPFHMPGHKRNIKSTPLKGAFPYDITEIDGFDNLHQEEGIILEAQKRAASLYGADRTFFLVNGSTSGVLAALSAAVPENGRVLAARGSHRSFYHGAYIRHLNIEYLPVKMMENYGIFDGYTGEDVERALDALDKPVDAVFITSPTYEGRCSDTEGIATVCHRKGILLIVDAAHGAHFGLGEGVPKSPVQQGADITITSVHKTLPSMTQTALIHIKGKRVDEERLKRFLRIYQSSSPSYVLMASIDLCISEMEQNGKQFTNSMTGYRQMIQKNAEALKVLKIPGTDVLQDPAKVLIYTGSNEITGQQLADILLKKYSLQLEMAGEKYALAIVTGWDTKEGIERLIRAITEIDLELQAKTHEKSAKSFDKDSFTKQEEEIFSVTKIPERRLPLYKAWDCEKEIVPIAKCTGRIAGEFVNLYPPGIPLIVPGEVIDDKLIRDIEKYLKYNMNVQGVFEVENTQNKGIMVIDEYYT